MYSVKGVESETGRLAKEDLENPKKILIVSGGNSAARAVFLNV